MEMREGQPPFCNLEELIIYFNQQGQPEKVARRFYDHYRSNGWKTARETPVSDWKCFARAWIKREKAARN